MMVDVSTLLSPAAMKQHYPLTNDGALFLLKSQKTANHICKGKDPRKAVIVGPCSIHDKRSAMEYARRFKELAKKVEDSLFLIMRVYVEKSRTVTGWKGLLYDPYLDGTHDVQTGLMWARELFHLLTDLGIPTATEFVDPLVACYFHDLITWGFVGARTSASQPHRQFASSLTIPIGFKNSTDGTVDDAVHGVAAANIPHSFLSIDEEGRLALSKSQGNSGTHIVLRGGNDCTNYDVCSVADAVNQLKKWDLPTRLMIDCSHGNCQKQFHKQADVFNHVMEQWERGNETIFSLMLESHLEAGNQAMTNQPEHLKYSQSITDPCIDWETTETLILSAHQVLSSCLIS